MQTFDECFVSARICVSVMRRSVFLTVAQPFGWTGGRRRALCCIAI